MTRRRRKGRNQTGRSPWSIVGQFSPRLTEMLWSPAYRVLSRGAHQFLSRLEIELGIHWKTSGNDYNQLALTYKDLIAYGMSRNQIAPAMREAVALGFAKC